MHFAGQSNYRWHTDGNNNLLSAVLSSFASNDAMLVKTLLINVIV